MPNWCFNSLNVSGSPEELKRFDEQFKGKHMVYNGASSPHEPTEDEKKDLIDYREYTDTLLMELGFEPRQEWSYLREILEEEGYSFSNFIEMTRDDFLNGWYQWSVEHWGTKWDLSEVNTNHEDDRKYYYSFLTAWSPPEPVIEEMSKQYPDLVFLHTFEEEGNDYYGEVKYYNGKVIKNMTLQGSDVYEYYYNTLKNEEYVKCQHCGNIQSVWMEDPCFKCGNPVLVNPQGDHQFKEEEEKALLENWSEEIEE